MCFNHEVAHANYLKWEIDIDPASDPDRELEQRRLEQQLHREYFPPDNHPLSLTLEDFESIEETIDDDIRNFGPTSHLTQEELEAIEERMFEDSIRNFGPALTNFATIDQMFDDSPRNFDPTSRPTLEELEAIEEMMFDESPHNAGPPLTDFATFAQMFDDRGYSVPETNEEADNEEVDAYRVDLESINPNGPRLITFEEFSNLSFGPEYREEYAIPEATTDGNGSMSDSMPFPPSAADDSMSDSPSPPDDSMSFSPSGSGIA